MSASRSKTNPGYKKVTLQIGAEEFAFAERMADEDGFFGVEDCLNGVLATAMTRLMSPDDHNDDPLGYVIRHQEAKIEVLKEMLLDALRTSFRNEETLRQRNEPDIPF